VLVAALAGAHSLVLPKDDVSNDRNEGAGSGNVNGITGSEILIGSSAALSGHAGHFGTQYLHGSIAYLNEVNANGGVHGRKIRVISYDDYYEPAHTVANTQKLILEDKVFLLFDYVGTSTGVRVINMVADAKIPLFGLFTGAMVFRTSVQPYIFNTRASYHDEAKEAVDYFVKHHGFSRIAVFYQDDEFGHDVLDGVNIALDKYGLNIVAEGKYIRGTDDVDSFESIRDSNPEAIIIAGISRPSAKFVALYRDSGHNPYFYTGSFVDVDTFAAELSKYGTITSERIIVTHVVPAHYENSTVCLEVVKKYMELSAKYFPDEEQSCVGLEGYINAVLLVKILEDSGWDLTRDKFIKTAESLNGYTAEVEALVTFGPNDHQAFDKTYISYLSNKTFHLIEAGAG